MGPHPPDGTSFDLFAKTRCRWTLARSLRDPGNENQVLDLRSAVTNPIALGPGPEHVPLDAARQNPEGRAPVLSAQSKH